MLDLLMNRRTIRKYKDQEVDKETIDKIIKGALTSPSGSLGSLLLLQIKKFYQS